MKQPEEIQAAQQRFAELVQNYRPEEHTKRHSLEPFTDNIRVLREQGTTYKHIKQLLEQAGVEVCVATVARFCQSRTLNTAKKKASKRTLKKEPQKRVITTSETIGTETPSKTLSSSSESTAGEQRKKRKGPRIADPRKI